jgi:hypothetical protein
MKVLLPKELRSVLFPKVFTIELNGFDIDLFLPSLFFTILAGGRGRSRRVNDPTAIAGYIDKLAHHPDLEGFQDTEGRRILERLARTTLFITGSVGRAHRDEQILSIFPYTVLAHKAGFPTEVRRQRGADTFIYQALHEQLGSDEVLRRHVKEVFGRGVRVGNLPMLGGTYDGQMSLDTITRLSIAFLDELQDTGVAMSRNKKSEPSACPALTRELATDLLRYLFAYYDLMPSQAFTYYLLALINFELFSYTLKLVYAINALVRSPDALPLAMQEPYQPSSPHIYLDFTGVTGSLSMEMAKSCVRRDIDAYQQFFTSNLLLRQLSRYVDSLSRNPRWRNEIDIDLQSTSSGPLYLQGLLLLRNHPRIGPQINAAAIRDEDLIRQENTHIEEGGQEEELQWLDEIANTSETDVERVVALISETQRGQTLSKYIQWFWGVGGMTKPHGVLSGTTRSRQSWKYAPSNDLLSVLVQLATARVSAPGGEIQNTKHLRVIRLQEFLTFLEERFGILIDRPPPPFEGSEYIAAARENLRAMLRRLRQMGIFRDLSDDFTVQRLHPPYADTYLEKSGAR